jgi:hypothetical protein
MKPEDRRCTCPTVDNLGLCWRPVPHHLNPISGFDDQIISSVVTAFVVRRVSKDTSNSIIRD